MARRRANGTPPKVCWPVGLQARSTGDRPLDCCCYRCTTEITDMPSRSRYNPPSSAAGGGRRSTTADVERSTQSSLADAAAKRVAQLHDEGDHIHCSEGNRVLLRQQNLDALRVALKAEIAEDDWMYDEDPLVAASAATLSSVAAASSSGAMVQGGGVSGSSSRGDAGGADRAAVTAMYLERVAEQRALAMARSGGR